LLADVAQMITANDVLDWEKRGGYFWVNVDDLHAMMLPPIIEKFYKRTLSPKRSKRFALETSHIVTKRRKLRGGRRRSRRRRNSRRKRR